MNNLDPISLAPTPAEPIPNQLTLLTHHILLRGQSVQNQFPLQPVLHLYRVKEDTAMHSLEIDAAFCELLNKHIRASLPTVHDTIQITTHDHIDPCLLESHVRSLYIVRVEQRGSDLFDIFSNSHSKYRPLPFLLRLSSPCAATIAFAYIINMAVTVTWNTTRYLIY